MSALKKEFLDLLDKDLEFRYAIAGYLGLSEILKRLDTLSDEQRRLREEQVKTWQELMKLREDMVKGFERHDKILERHEQELMKLREDFNKMLEVIRNLQESYFRLEEGQRSLRQIYKSLESSVESLRNSMLGGFGELCKFAGITFEDFVRKFLTTYLRGLKEIPKGAKLKRAIVDGEEIDLFLEDPLIVGEITSYTGSLEEVSKLLRKAELIKTKYYKEPRKFLIILTAKKDIFKDLKRMSKERGIELLVGKVG